MFNTRTSKKLPPELHQLEEIVGQFIQYWGFKRIHGRIWTHLFTSKVPLDSQELMDRLGVSKGLMSLAIRDLLEHEVITTSHSGKHGTVYYQANQDLMGVISKVLRSRESVMLGSAKMSAEALLRLKPAEMEKNALSAEQIQIVLNLTASAQGILAAFLQRGGGEQGSLFDSIA